jgi:hypothetical protein
VADRRRHAAVLVCALLPFPLGDRLTPPPLRLVPVDAAAEPELVAGAG